MKLMRDDVFLNAEVKYKDKIYYVVKINEKSLYLAPDKDFLKKYEERPKGWTWKKWCSRFDVIMVKYNDGIEIDEVEVAKGNDFIVPKKKNKKYLTRIEEREIVSLYKKFEKGRSGCFAFFETSKAKIYPIAYNNGQVLIRKNDKYFFYDLELDTYILFKRLGDEKKELIWPREEKIEEKKAV